jgi:hypothetical protein
MVRAPTLPEDAQTVLSVLTGILPLSPVSNAVSGIITVIFIRAVKFVVVIAAPGKLSGSIQVLPRLATG